MATAAPNPLASGDTAYLYRAAIGPQGQDYYLRHFARFDGEGKTGTSWNWAAYWTTFNWLVYRRMWGWALAYVAALIGLALLVFGVGKLVLNYSDTSAILLSLALLTAAFVLPGLYANAWFYTHCNEKITAALRQTPDLKQAATALAADAPDRRRMLLLATVNAALLAVAAVLVQGLQSAGSDLPQLAAREERVPVTGQAGQVTPPPPVAQPAPPAPAPEAVVAKAETVPQPASAPPLPATPVQTAQPATPPPPAAAPTALTPPSPASAAVNKPPMIQAADRAPARPEPVQAAPRAARPAAAPAAAVASTPPAPRPAASAPVALRYVWVVQVGAYAQAENASKALAQVQSLGLEAGAETFGSQPLTRVRVGPFTRQAEAEQAALRIKSLDLPALVIRQRP